MQTNNGRTVETFEAVDRAGRLSDESFITLFMVGVLHRPVRHCQHRCAKLL